ncbi:MAG TPA: ABC transporter permease, partial [Longimicrobiaceae bacterium]|nr:ABC transporter permease [Longimicrobiaceae bacterium]
METLWQDVRYAARKLIRSPGFTTVAVLTLALGIGANTAIFSVIDAVLLKPLEYQEPDELVFINSQFPTLGFDQFWISPPEYREIQEYAESFSEVGAWRTGSASISAIENPQRVTAATASAELFRVLGVAPQLGRTYTEEEDTEGAAAVVVISDGLWRGTFGADPGIVGSTIQVNGAPTTVLGVMPPGFDIEEAEV